MTDIKKRFREAGLTNLALLYTRASTLGLSDCGSSSIDPSFTSGIEEVKQVLRERAGVLPSNVRTAALWASTGDPSANFYFSGVRLVENKVERVNTSLYLTILVDHLHEISPEAMSQLDTLAKIFSGVLSSGQLTDLEAIDELDD